MQGMWVRSLGGKLRYLMTHGQKSKQKQYYSKFNKDFKNGPHQKNIFKEKK